MATAVNDQSATSNLGDLAFGTTSTNDVAQEFQPAISNNLYSIVVRLDKVGTPTDALTLSIWNTSASGPTSLIATSPTTITGADLTTSMDDYEYLFNINDVLLTSNTKYAFVLKRSGDYDDSNYYQSRIAVATYANGSVYTGSQATSWSSSGVDMNFTQKTYTQNWAKESRTTEDKVAILAANNSLNSSRLSDQLMYKFGTTRISEIKAQIGNTGEPYSELLNNYLDTL